MGLAGSTALPGGDARAQVADLCTGLSLDESLLRDRLVPLVQSVVNPIQGTVNPIASNLGTIVGSLTANIPIVGPILSPTGLVPVTALNLDVDGLFDTVAVGDPLAIQLLAPDGTLIGPGDDCVVAADSFQLDGTQGLSIGGNTITGLGAAGAANVAVAAEIDAIALGDRAATGAGSAGALALGVDSEVGAAAAGGIALGDTATVGAGAAGSIAIGAGATVAQANSIALGAGSVTTRGAEAGYLALGLGAGQASTGELAVGGRTLTGLAPGSAAGDAVNVAQLGSVAAGIGATAATIGGGASFDPATGLFTPPAFLVQGAPRPTVGDALTALDGQVSTNTTNITNLANGTVGLVQQLDPAAAITVGGATGGGEVSIAGTAGPRTLTGLADGAVAAGSTAAVTGGQLAATNATVGALGTGLVGTATTFGAGAAFDPVTGTFTPPAFTLAAEVGAGIETFDNVGDALGNLDGRTLTNTTDITNLANGTVGLVQQLIPGGPVTVAAGTGGTVVGFAGTDGPRVLTGVGAGVLAEASTDAVTGAQLFATNATVGALGTGLVGTAATFGAGASFDPVTGIFTPPAFVLGEADETFANVGDALENIDGRTIGNTTSITNLTAQIGSGTIGLVQQADPAGVITVGGVTGGGEISIAGTAGPRTLTGLADGAVAAGSTAAVTGGQLAATNATVAAGLGGTAALIGAGASFDPVTGLFTPPAFVLGEADETFANVGDALENIDGRTIGNTTNIANLTAQIGSGAIGLVQQADPAGVITVGGVTGGGEVSIAGTAGPRTLTGLADGAVAAGSTAAVTGSQLAATNATVAAGLGGTAALIGAGASFDPVTGVFTPPAFVLGEADETFATVGDALENLDGRTITNTTNIATNTTNIANLTAQIGSGSIGLVQQADPAGAITIGAATGGTVLNVAGTAGPRTLGGLADGAVAAGSTEAVTGNQLAATNAAVGTLGTGLAANAAALGGGASYDPATGTFAPPSYFVQGAARGDVGTALGALDGQVNVNTADIANLQVQVGNGTVGLVQQAAPGAALTVGAATDGDAVVFNQAGGATRLVTGLTDGTVAAGSTDAVTGNQAFATGQSIASALGGGATVAADGTLTAPTYTVGGTGFTDAGSAFAALDASVTGLQNQVGAFDPDGSLVFVSVNSAAGPARATGTETVAIGGGAVASGANSAAYGSGALATGAGSSAFGQGASAGFANSAAFGSGATATRDNQMVFGTAANTYTTPGITSAASRAAQSGPLDVVTTDAAGNLASLPLSDFFSGVSAIENQLGRMDRRLDRQSDGIAIAMALGAVALPSDKTFALTGSIGYFDDTAAFGIGAIGQIADGWYLNGGVGVGTERGTVAGRAGLTYAW